MDQIHNPVLIV